MSNKWKLWKIVKASWHAYGSNDTGRMSLSTHDTGLDGPDPKDFPFSQGAVVIDARCISDEQAIDNAFKGPMVDVTLPAGHVSHWPSPERLYVVGEKLTSTMSVALDIYVDFWRQFPEVRIGKIDGLVVRWEDRGSKALPEVFA